MDNTRNATHTWNLSYLSTNGSLVVRTTSMVSRQRAALAAKCIRYSALAVATGSLAQLVDPHVALFNALSAQLERAATVGRRGTLLRVLLKNALV